MESDKKSIEGYAGDIVMKEEDIFSTKSSIDGINTGVNSKYGELSFVNGVI